MHSAHRCIHKGCFCRVGWGSPIACVAFLVKSIFFIIKVGIESCSVNRYNCHLRGEIRVLVAIETDSSHHLFPCKLRKENNPLWGQPAWELGLTWEEWLSGCGWTVSASYHKCLMVFLSLLFYLLSPKCNIILSFISDFKTQLTIVGRARL